MPAAIKRRLHYGGCGCRRCYRHETTYLSLRPRLSNSGSMAHGSGEAIQQRQEAAAASTELRSRLVTPQKVNVQVPLRG